jgi:hypothetical protein
MFIHCSNVLEFGINIFYFDFSLAFLVLQGHSTFDRIATLSGPRMLRKRFQCRYCLKWYELNQEQGLTRIFTVIATSETEHLPSED